MSENTAAQPSLVELRVYTALCFLFGRERQNWAFSQLELGDRCRLSAGYDGSCSFNERPSKKHRKEKKARHTGQVKHHQPHPLLCKESGVEKQQTVMICFFSTQLK